MPISAISTAACYVRFDDAGSSAYDLAAGAGLKGNRYSIADIAITGLAAGTYAPVICLGTAAAQSVNDQVIGQIPRFVWNGTAEVLEDAVVYAGVASVLPEQLDGIFNSVSALESATHITAEQVHPKRTWYAGIDGSRADNIVTVKAPFSGSLAALLALNDDGDLDTVDEVTITDPDEELVETTNLRKSGDGRTAICDCDLTTIGNYEVVWTVSPVDGDALSMECKLVVR